jgi:hypothetical protein
VEERKLISVERGVVLFVYCYIPVVVVVLFCLFYVQGIYENKDNTICLFVFIINEEIAHLEY